MEPVARAKNVLDTYALVELIGKNKKFMDITEEPFILADDALAELYGVMFRTLGKEKAEYWFMRFSLYSVPVPHDLLKEAVLLRKTRKELNLSMPDAAGYLLARHLGLPFVTGDKSFKDLPGVDFRPAISSI